MDVIGSAIVSCKGEGEADAEGEAALSDEIEATAIEAFEEGRMAVSVGGELAVSDSYSIDESSASGTVCDAACIP